ncbi:unnamed protein product [Rhizophagus irregularis]|uniref:Uncharacterized protein n=1 Tax=Rhizophagus irregularis TaxID=588596 RepID=A0A2I1GHE2_9GLOM|nr:hypothetical protein RhiirA4_543053 [Rhizophagus irregularis]CAB4402313.1 unnamed protein product [Rhizophagus irregularis]
MITQIKKRGNQRYYDREYGEDKGNSREDRGKQGPNVKFFRGERSQNQGNEQNNMQWIIKVETDMNMIDVTMGGEGLITLGDTEVIQLIKNINNRKEEEKGDEGKVGGVKKKRKQLDTNDNNNNLERNNSSNNNKRKSRSNRLNMEFDYKLIKVYLLDQTDQAFTWSDYQKTKGGEVIDRKKVVEKWEEFENIITEKWINRLEMDFSNVE